MKHLLLAAAGGAIGAGARHLVAHAALRILGPHFPWGTPIVNVVGSFLMGLLVAALALRFNLNNEMRIFLATGVLGGFTTFSAFSLDVVNLIERHAQGPAAVYVLASVVLSVGGLFAGLSLGRNVFA